METINEKTSYVGVKELQTGKNTTDSSKNQDLGEYICDIMTEAFPLQKAFIYIKEVYIYILFSIHTVWKASSQKRKKTQGVFGFTFKET